MNNKRNEHRDIENKLKKMPEIKDSRDKAAIYTRISSELNEKENPGRKKKRIWAASAAAAAIFLIMLIPVYLNTDMQETSEEDAIEQASDLQTDEIYESEESLPQHEQESNEQSTEEQEISILSPEYESFVVHDTGQYENIYFAGVSDIQEQYVIPVAFITTGEWDLQSFYNNMDTYMQELDNHTGVDIFENVKFQIDQRENEVVLKLPNDFSFDGSTAMANMFENMLSTMFRPYGTDKVTIQTDDGTPAELDPFGQIDELPLREMTPSSYKLYAMENTGMLVPVPRDEQTGIEGAIMSMKEDEAEFHVYKTVPEDFRFSIETERDPLTLVFSDDTVLTDDEISLRMIEAVLMTAKSYGYERVSFDNTGQEHVGPYNLSEPVPVPEAVNPIYLDDQ